MNGGYGNHDKFYFSRSAQLVPNQDFKTPTLLISAQDWSMVLNSVHPDAFGRDFHELTASQVVRTQVQGQPLQGGWYVVWKFPVDLNDVPGFRRIIDIPLPVGAYHMRDEHWYIPNPPATLTLPMLPIGSVTMKYRIDKRDKDAFGVSFLEGRDGTRVTMITNRAFSSRYDSPLLTERQLVETFLETMWTRFRIYAFYCGQHHAIVLYSVRTMTHNGQIRSIGTPETIADMLTRDVALRNYLDRAGRAPYYLDKVVPGLYRPVCHSPQLPGGRRSGW